MAYKRSTPEYLNLAAARAAEGAAMALAATSYDDHDLTPAQRAQVQAVEDALWDARRALLDLARTLTAPAVKAELDRY